MFQGSSYGLLTPPILHSLTQHKILMMPTSLTLTQTSSVLNFSIRSRIDGRYTAKLWTRSELDREVF